MANKRSTSSGSSVVTARQPAKFEPKLSTAAKVKARWRAARAAGITLSLKQWARGEAVQQDPAVSAWLFNKTRNFAKPTLKIGRTRIGGPNSKGPKGGEKKG